MKGGLQPPTPPLPPLYPSMMYIRNCKPRSCPSSLEQVNKLAALLSNMHAYHCCFVCVLYHTAKKEMQIILLFHK